MSFRTSTRKSSTCSFVQPSTLVNMAMVMPWIPSSRFARTSEPNSFCFLSLGQVFIGHLYSLVTMLTKPASTSLCFCTSNGGSSDLTFFVPSSKRSNHLRRAHSCG